MRTPDAGRPSDPQGGRGQRVGNSHNGWPQRLFVISVCDGIGAVFVALMAFIAAVEGIACESMEHLREFTGRTFPGTTSAVDVAALAVADIIAAARRAGADAILLAGGPPCPLFSPLSGNPQGWSDPRTGPLRHFVRLKNELAEACQREGLRFRWFMEEVATMAAVHHDEISRLLDAAPALIHAADFGFVHRARYYWGLLPITCALPAAIEVLQAGAAAFDVVVLRWLGKPSPARWEPDGGFTWKFRGVWRGGSPHTWDRLPP